MCRAVLSLVVVALSAGLSCAGGLVSPSDPRVAAMGRIDRGDPTRLRFGYPGVTFRLAFEGPSLGARLSSTTGNSRMEVIVDGRPARILRVPMIEETAVLAEGLSPGRHTVDLIHRTETWQGIVSLRGFVPAPGGRLLTPSPWPARRLLFIGDSVTCGEAIDREQPAPVCARDTAAASNSYLSYGMILARRLDAQVHLVCYGGRGLVRDWRGNRRVANAPQFFDLTIVETRRPITWAHETYVPEVVVISLGTNDFNLDLGDLPERDEYVSAYVTFVRAIRAHAPRAHLFLTEGAIVSDETDPRRPQRAVLRAYIKEAAARLGDQRVHVVEAVHYPGDACNPHPTRQQHQSMAKDLEPAIRQALGW